MTEAEALNPNKAPKTAREKKTPKPVTAKRLENIALYHLERFPSSAANLRQVLLRRVRKAARFHDTDEAQASEWIAEIIAKLTRMGLLDDLVYAEAQARKMVKRGTSRRSALAKLQAKGVDPGTAETALESVQDELGANAEQMAAEKYAQRRRLGPYRTKERTEESDRKDMAAMARAGYPYDVVQSLLAREDKA